MFRFLFVLCAAAITSQDPGTGIIINAPINISESLLDQIIPFMKSSSAKGVSFKKIPVTEEAEEAEEAEEETTSSSSEEPDLNTVYAEGPTNALNESHQIFKIDYSLQPDNGCEVDYITILHSEKQPEDKCTIQEFAFNDGTIGPKPTPDIGKLEMNEVFSVNVDEHVMEMNSLLELFLDCATFKDFKNAALYYKKKVNPMLFTFAFSSAIIHREDTKSFSVPGLYNMMPDHFFNSQTITQKNAHVNKMIYKTIKKSPRKRKQNPIMHGSVLKERDYSVHPQNAEESTRKVEIFNNENSISLSLRSNTFSELIISYKDKIQKFKKKFKKIPIPQSFEKQSFTIPNFSSPIQIAKRPHRPLKAVPTIDKKKWMPDQTGSIRNPEHIVSYFREDIAINSHHWHWHVLYRPSITRGITPPDRKGELFYYMHNQMLRRYNAERLAAQLPFVEPLRVTEPNGVLEEGYYPHLRDYAKREFSGRTHNLKFQDVSRDNKSAKISDMQMWENNLKRAIKNGYMKGSQNEIIPLDSVSGINTLGNAIECSDASPNKNKYGSLHNTGHILLGLIHDPLDYYKASSGVLLATETALRDPAFWRWHKYIDNICALHKAQLKPYTDEELYTPNILITEVVIRSTQEQVLSPKYEHTYKKNELGTFFKKTVLHISHGMDFEMGNNVYDLKIFHLDHHRYDISIHVFVDEAPNVEGQVRIFMAPKYDQHKRKFTIQEMQNYAIEMDRFPVTLTEGSNLIMRSSRESAVTMAPKIQWANIDQINKDFTENGESANFCGCGWPDHLLVPKGTPEGIDYVLFVMISDRTEEKVDDDHYVVRTCEDSLTMCGLLNKKFPDKRAMGFPLDRPIPEDASYWFNRNNMYLLDVKIFHENDIPKM